MCDAIRGKILDLSASLVPEKLTFENRDGRIMSDKRSVFPYKYKITSFACNKRENIFIEI